MWPWVLGLLLFLGLSAVGVYVLVELPGFLRRRGLPFLPDPPRLSERRRAEPARGRAGWLQGADLLRYPSRLEELEAQLIQSLENAEAQRRHLEERGDEVRSKGGRTDIATRYAEDAAMLLKRSERMRRVLALVWKTRAVLTIRAHVAVTARRRPDLDGLPQGDVPMDRLASAETSYRRAAEQVRSFVGEVDDRIHNLGFAIPDPPTEATVAEEMRDEVRSEELQVRNTYTALREQMDHLSDTLAYMADHCRTRRVVEHTPARLDAAPGSSALLEQVAEALGALNELSQAGDRHLADLAVDNLAEDISHLERAGLEAEAEAEAALEVARLLEQFQG